MQTLTKNAEFCAYGEEPTVAVSPVPSNLLPDSDSSAYSLKDVKDAFPIFQNQPDVIFLDSASTTQKPDTVLKRINAFYNDSCANAGRASYRWSSQLTQEIELVRQRVASFIGASEGEVIFTSGATDSLNMVAMSWGLRNLKDGDEVMLCHDDHKSAVLPWLNLKRILARCGVNIKIVSFNMHETGLYELQSIRDCLTSRTRVLAMSHIHHVYGREMEVEVIRKVVGPDVVISLDASQSASHTAIDVNRLGVDFLSFSAHKMFAGNGAGVLWISKEHHNSVDPVRLGGMSSVSVADGDDITFNTSSIAGLLECGTQNIPSILSLRPALDFIESIGIERIESRLSHLTHYLFAKLKQLPGIEFAPGMGTSNCAFGYGIIAFRFQDVSSIDIGLALDSDNIFVRTGDHCVGKAEQNTDFVRISLHVYNNESDIDRFVDVMSALVC